MSSKQQKPLQRAQSKGGGLRGQLAQETAADHSPNIDRASLALRESAARRTSAVTPPTKTLLDAANGDDDDVDRRRKASEVTRPAFKIREEAEAAGVFASGILQEKQTLPTAEGGTAGEASSASSFVGRLAFMEERSRSSDGFAFSFLDRGFGGQRDGKE